MGQEKKNENKNEGDKKKGNGGGKEEEKTTVLTVVLKVDMHCEGCASKIVKCVRGFDGVEAVKSEPAGNKLTVTGAVDPSKIRERLQEKTKKKVELISPQPKKEKGKENENKNSKESKQDDNKKNKDDDKKSDGEKKKPKEPPVTTAVLKLSLHCHGCIEKIHKTIVKTTGVQEMSMDKQKELVTVKGTMDVNALTAGLTEKLKRPVDIVPQKKEKKDSEKETNGDGAAKGGLKKKKGGGGGGSECAGQEENDNGGGGGGKMEYVAGQPGSEYGFVYAYPYGPNGHYPMQAHAPQIFSDENPNACTVM